MAQSYLNFERYRRLSELPRGRLDALEQKHPGDCNEKLEQLSRYLEDRLRHKYRIPFPERHSTIEGWIVALVDPWALNQIGYDGTGSDSLVARIEKREDQTLTELADAVKPDSANINLPLKDGKDGTAIAKGAPRGYAENSPYDWVHRQGRRRRV